MRQRSFRKIKSDNFDVNQVQENVEQTFRQVLDNPVLDGVLLRSITLSAAAENLVAHRLGRQAIGYIVTRRSAEATIYDSNSETVVEQNFLKLSTSADVVVDLWIF